MFPPRVQPAAAAAWGVLLETRLDCSRGPDTQGSTAGKSVDVLGVRMSVFFCSVPYAFDLANYARRLAGVQLWER